MLDMSEEYSKLRGTVHWAGILKDTTPKLYQCSKNDDGSEASSSESQSTPMKSGSKFRELNYYNSDGDTFTDHSENLSSVSLPIMFPIEEISMTKALENSNENFENPDSPRVGAIGSNDSLAGDIDLFPPPTLTRLHIDQSIPPLPQLRSYDSPSHKKSGDFRIISQNCRVLSRLTKIRMNIIFLAWNRAKNACGCGITQRN